MVVQFAKINDLRLAEMASAHWREKAAKMRFKEGQMQELVAGGLLSEMTGIKEARIELSENGKPFFADYPEVYFNLSHSGEYVMCVIANHPIGCDIEKDVPLDDELKKEIGSILKWTLKEASFKGGPSTKPYLVNAPQGYFAAVAE